MGYKLKLYDTKEIRAPTLTSERVDTLGDRFIVLGSTVVTITSRTLCIVYNTIVDLIGTCDRKLPCNRLVAPCNAETGWDCKLLASLNRWNIERSNWIL